MNVGSQLNAVNARPGGSDGVMSTEACVGSGSIGSLKVMRTLFTTETSRSVSRGSVAVTEGGVQSSVRFGFVSVPWRGGLPVSRTVPRIVITPQFVPGVVHTYGDWSPARPVTIGNQATPSPYSKSTTS